MVANSFNPLDQSSEVMTLAEMQEREVVCSSSVSSKSCIQSLNVYHLEEKITRPQPQDQGLRLFSQLLASLVLLPLSLHMWLTGAVKTKREYTPKQHCQPGVPRGRQLLSPRLQGRVVAKDREVSLDQGCPQELSTVLGMF